MTRPLCHWGGAERHPAAFQWRSSGVPYLPDRNVLLEEQRGGRVQLDGRAGQNLQRPEAHLESQVRRSGGVRGVRGGGHERPPLTASRAGPSSRPPIVTLAPPKAGRSNRHSVATATLLLLFWRERRDADIPRKPSGTSRMFPELPGGSPAGGGGTGPPPRSDWPPRGEGARSERREPEERETALRPRKNTPPHLDPPR